MSSSADLETLLSVTAIDALDELLGDRSDATLGLMSLDGTLLWASTAGSQGMFHRELREFEGQRALDYIHPEDRYRYEGAMERAIDGETVSSDVRALSGDGSWLAVRYIMWRVEDADGNPALLTVTSAQ